jgi:hypothetical protein
LNEHCSTVRATSFAPVHVQGDGLVVGGDSHDFITELFGGRYDQPAPRRARQAESLVTSKKIDFAILKTMIKILPGLHRVAELTVTSSLHADAPARLVNVHPARQVAIFVVGVKWDLIPGS